MSEACTGIWSHPPEDILRIIFEAGQRDDLLFNTLVASICRSWRIVALTTPKLWTTISSERPTQCYHWLGRSKAVPLDVTLINKTHDLLDSDLLQEVALNLFRIRSLLIKVLASGNPIWIRHLFIAFNHPAPNLENLTVELSIACPWPRVTRTEPIFGGHVPRLSALNLTLMQEESGWTSPFFTPALHHLTLTHSSNISSWNVWSNVRNLRRLRLEDITWTDLGSPERPADILVLPFLESLSLRRVARKTAVSIIRATTAPALSYLSIDLRHPPDRQAGIDIVNALMQSNLPLHRLHTLRIQVASMEITRCVQLLRELPSLERLSFYNAEVDSWLDALGKKHDGRWMCPRLTRIVLNLCELHYCTALRLACRRKAGAIGVLPIQFISLQFCWYFPPDRYTPIVLPDSDVIEILLPGSRSRGTSLSELWYSDY